MRLREYEGKQLLQKHGIEIPAGWLLRAEDTMTVETDCVLKCQVLEGGRGKAGLVRKVSASDSGAVISTLRAAMHDKGYVPDILVEQVTDIEAEYYACVRIDDVAQRIAILFSTQGGIDVEASGGVKQLHLSPLEPITAHALVPFLTESGAPARQVGPLARFLARLCTLCVAEDALQVEINPLALTKGGKLLALDAKVELDDSAAFRHMDRPAVVRYPTIDPLESEAAKLGITFVKLNGNIALLTGGAGLGMGIVDELGSAGLAAANFIDTPAGVNIEKKIDFVLERAKDPEVDLIGIYVFQTAQPLSRVVLSLIDKVKIAPLPKPVVVGIAAAGAGQRGMTISEATQLLAEYDIPVTSEIDEFVAELATKLGEKRPMAVA